VSVQRLASAEDARNVLSEEGEATSFKAEENSNAIINLITGVLR
jgi:hypothetical protein